jgi:hypothetical protein
MAGITNGIVVITNGIVVTDKITKEISKGQ